MTAPSSWGPKRVNFAGPQPNLNPRSSTQFSSVMVLVACLVYAVALPLAIASGDFDLWGGFLVAPVLVVIGVPLIRKFSRGEEPWIQRLMVAALYTKLLGAGLRYFVTFSVLGAGDARAYHLSGAAISKEFRGFNFGGTAYQEEIPKLVGTSFIKLLTGIVYMFSPAAEMSGFMIYSFMGFWGLFLFYKAFRIAVPDGKHRRYAVLVFFMPSLVFWPSSIGKEAWMLLTLGIVAYGAARIFTHQRFGFPIAGLGLWATAMVRPHVTLIVFLALAVGYIMRPAPRAQANTAPLRKIVGIALLIAVGALVVSRTQTFFGVDNLDTATTDEIITDVEGQTSEGTGSVFETTRPTNPLEYPNAFVSVLFRPFPYEADTGPAMIAAIEGIVLIILIFNPRRLRILPRAFARRPYVAFSVTFALLFVYGFSAIGNFGILVRQRTQVLPFVLVLAALPILTPERKRPVPPPPGKSLRSAESD